MMLAPRRPTSHFRSLVRLLLAVTLVPTSAANIAASAVAQEYQTFPVDEKARNNYGVAQQCLKDPAAYAANKDKFNSYFVDFHFPSMTRTEPDKLGAIGKLRDDLFKYFLWRTSDASLQRDLTTLTYKQMGKIVGANPPCHPAARYNAILIIGQLDDQYSAPAKPYAPATNALVGVITDAATVNKNQFPPSVVMGALVGLERHALLKDNMPPEAVTAMRNALLKLVAHEEPIQEMDRDAYSWMRLRAASALARLGSVGEKNAVHDAIVKLAVTNKSLDDRCAALSLLERINYKDVKLDDANTAEPIFSLARDVVAAEDKRADTFQDQGGGGGVYAPAARAMGPDVFSGGGSTYDPTAYPRRQTLARLVDLRSGLNVVKPGLPPETQKKVDAVLAAINPVITAAGGKDTVDLKLAEMIHTMSAAVNKVIPGPVKAEDKEKETAVF